jgi:hypothetical protein
MPTLLDLLNIDYEKSEGRSLIKNESNPFIFVHNKAVIRQDDMKVLFDGNESYLIGCNTTFVNKGNYINRLFNLSSLEKVYLFINDYKSLTANHSNNDFRDELDYFEIYLNSTIADNNCSIQEFYFGNFLLFNLSKDPKEENPIDDSESANILLNEFNLLLTRPRAKREKFDLYPNLLADKLKSLGYSN